MSKTEAIKLARANYRKAVKENGGDSYYDRIYVVSEDNQFSTASDYDIDTFYAGIRPENIVFCAAD